MIPDVRIPDPRRFIEGSGGSWELVIGMEVHAQISSCSKLFSGASAAFGAKPNENVSFLDAAMPGTLPVLNEKCVYQAIRTGLGLNATINHRSIFDRKHYFYPDSPSGYQISQFHSPIVGEGWVLVSVGPDLAGDFEEIEVRIARLHLEQDAGKSIHEHYPDMSLIDLNRAGVALMEIVSAPDLRSCDEAKAYLTKLRSILRYLGTCDGNMDEGSLRADVNVSVRKPGEELGTRCEIKNINSIRFVGQAIEYESRRQIMLLEKGQKIDQETRLFDEINGKTRSMRSKEEAHDYRFFPDPNLLPLELNAAYVEEIRKSMPELPDEKKERFIQEMGLSFYDASVLVSEKALAEYFERLVRGRDPKIAANWVINDLTGNINKFGYDVEKSPVSSDQLGEILDLLAEGKISGKMARDLFEIVWKEGGNPRELIETHSMIQVTDVVLLNAMIDKVIRENPEKLGQALIKPALIGWFVGRVMQESAGKANPKIVDELLRCRLQEIDENK